MAKSTDRRNLRLLIDGILRAYGVDNLEITAKMMKAFDDFFTSDDPIRTREEILASLQTSILKGSTKQAQLDQIGAEINMRVGIRPVTKDWVDFIEFASREANKKQHTITEFLNWWLSDQWQREHPPTKPDGWYVKWDLAFIVPSEPSVPNFTGAVDPDEPKYVPSPRLRGA